MRKPTRVDSSQVGPVVVDAPDGKGAVAAQVIKICLLLKILPIKCFAFSPEAHLKKVSPSGNRVYSHWPNGRFNSCFL